MGTKRLKLQNVIMQYDADADIGCYSRLMHHSSGGARYGVIYNPEEGCHIIRKYDVVDFASYFNCLQLHSWKEKTFADSFCLKITFKGKGVIEFSEHYRNSKNINHSVILRQVVNSEEKQEICIPIPESDKPLVSFSITALEDFFVYNACYTADIEESNIRDVRISLVSTTFRKEAYITRNIRLLKERVLSAESDIRDSIFVHVIDNGRTLDPSQLNCERLKVYPNPNTGGSGGFTRGMIEALALDPKPTHVLLMDDDVLIMDESIFRTFYLLRIIKPEFEEHFVSGAMFDYDRREIQYEDVGYVHVEDASYGPLKDRLKMSSVDALLKNEEMSGRRQNNSYAGWWYCCIPVCHIERNGLPLPLFVRGDDVEFSLRNNAEFVTMNGICIWHVGFAGKFNAAMELYQVHRNSLVIQAASGICGDIDFIKRMKNLFWKELTRFAYNNCQQILDAIDDFMKGPEFLEKLDGEASIKAHGGLNDKLQPIDSFPAKFNIKKGDPYSYRRIGLFKKGIYVLTLNGHFLPNFMLRSWPEIIAFDWFNVPGKNFRRKRLIAVNKSDGTACMREIDRKRCRALIKRYKKVMGNYKANHSAVEQAYKNEFANMTSEKFWKNYLGI